MTVSAASSARHTGRRATNTKNTNMPDYWLAIAPFEVCEAACRENFCQFGRGHMAPAVRMAKGDGVVLMGRSRGSLSPSETLYAVGVVDEGDAYAVPEQGREIWRRDVLWWTAEPTPLHLAGPIGRQPHTFATVRGSARLAPGDFLQLARALDLDLSDALFEEARLAAAAAAEAAAIASLNETTAPVLRRARR
jgi:hypothetical protein